MNWQKTLFLHIGWTGKYDGTEAPEGGHEYLKNSVGVEAENFLAIGGWCYGYAPVSRTSKGRGQRTIPKGDRTLNIDKLGAVWHENQVEGICVIWTARNPRNGPVIVGLYDDATVYRYMPVEQEDNRLFIAKAKAENCHLVPETLRTFEVIQKRKGFPGMAAAWFPGLHKEGPAKDFLATVAEYVPTIRRYSHNA